jgi:glycosyltransferase involved in cell wall biosynthesis
MTFTLVLPVMNEIVGLREIVPRIRRELFDQIIVVDGGSTDGTVEYALEQGLEVHRQVRRGLRLAYIEAYEKVKSDFMVTFSPDGNSIPELLPNLVHELKQGYDMVVVSRYLGKARSEDDTTLTWFGNFLFTRIINLLFGGRYTDSLVIFRGYRRSVPETTGVTRVRADRWERVIGRYVAWEPQLSARCARLGLRCGEIPGDEPRRIAEVRGNIFLPPSRINHFKSAFACLYMFFEDFLTPSARWRGGR